MDIVEINAVVRIEATEIIELVKDKLPASMELNDGETYKTIIDVRGDCFHLTIIKKKTK